MKKEFLKMAGVENEKDFYKLFPTEQAFFGMYPEAKKLLQKKRGGQLQKFKPGGFATTFSTTKLEDNKIPEGYYRNQYGQVVYDKTYQDPYGGGHNSLATARAQGKKVNDDYVNIVYYDRLKDKRVTKRIRRDSDKYRTFYRTGSLAGTEVDKEGNVYTTFNTEDGSAPDVKELPEVFIDGTKGYDKAKEGRGWRHYRRNYRKNHPLDAFLKNWVENEKSQLYHDFGGNMGWSEEFQQGAMDRAYQAYNDKMTEFVTKNIIKNNPQGDRNRNEWLNTFSPKEREILLNRPGSTLNQPNLWQQANRGALNLVTRASPLAWIADPNLIPFSSKILSEDQKKKGFVDKAINNFFVDQGYFHPEEVERYNNPLGTLEYLTAGSKMVQAGMNDKLQAYQNLFPNASFKTYDPTTGGYTSQYTMADAISGRANDASIVTDMLTDFTTYIPGGAFTKGAKVGSFVDDAARLGRYADNALGRTATSADNVLGRVGATADNVGVGVERSAVAGQAAPAPRLGDIYPKISPNKLDEMKLKNNLKIVDESEFQKIQNKNPNIRTTDVAVEDPQLRQEILDLQPKAGTFTEKWVKDTDEIVDLTNDYKQFQIQRKIDETNLANDFSSGKLTWDEYNQGLLDLKAKDDDFVAMINDAGTRSPYMQKVNNILNETGATVNSQYPYQFADEAVQRQKIVFPYEDDPTFKALSLDDQEYIRSQIGTFSGIRRPNSTITLSSSFPKEGMTVPNGYAVSNTQYGVIPGKRIWNDPSTWLNPNKSAELYKFFHRNPEDLKAILFTALHEGGHDIQKIKNWIEQLRHYDAKGPFNYYTSTNKNALAERFQAAMVDPVVNMKDPKGYTIETWRSVPSELHSNIMGARGIVAEELVKSGQASTMEDAIRLMKQNEDLYLDQIVNNPRVSQHFKTSTPIEERKFLIKNYMPAITGAGGTGLGLNFMFNNNNQNSNNQYKRGGLVKAQDGTEYTGSSIVDYLATKGYEGSKPFRGQLAKEYGVEGYDYSAAKNVELLKKIRQNQDILLGHKQSFSPIAVETIEQLHSKNKAGLNRHSSLPGKQEAKNNYNADKLNALLNIATMGDQYRQDLTSSVPGLSFQNTSLYQQYAPKHNEFRKTQEGAYVTTPARVEDLKEPPPELQNQKVWARIDNKDGTVTDYTWNAEKKMWSNELPEVVITGKRKKKPTQQEIDEFNKYLDYSRNVLQIPFAPPGQQPIQQRQNPTQQITDEFRRAIDFTSGMFDPRNPNYFLKRNEAQPNPNQTQSRSSTSSKKKITSNDLGFDLENLYDQTIGRAVNNANEWATETGKDISDWWQGMRSGASRKAGHMQEEDPSSVKSIDKTTPITVDYGYQEVFSVPDNANKNNSLVSFTNTFDNDAGGRYYIGHKAKEVTDGGAKSTFENSRAVAHFLRDSDILPGQKIAPEEWTTAKGNYKYHTTSPGKTVSAAGLNEPERYRMLYKPNPKNDGTYLVKYVKNKEITSEFAKTLSKEGWQLDFTVNGQHKYSEIDWDAKGPRTGYLNESRWVPLKNGKHTYIPYKRKDAFSRFSGGSGIYLFTDPKSGKRIGVDVSGSVEVLKKTGQDLIKKYGLKSEDLDFAYHDMGSYSAKPKAKEGDKLDYKQWLDFNTYNKGFSGAPLVIPKNKLGGSILPRMDVGGTPPDCDPGYMPDPNDRTKCIQDPTFFAKFSPKSIEALRADDEMDETFGNQFPTTQTTTTWVQWYNQNLANSLIDPPPGKSIMDMKWEGDPTYDPSKKTDMYGNVITTTTTSSSSKYLFGKLGEWADKSKTAKGVKTAASVLNNAFAFGNKLVADNQYREFQRSYEENLRNKIFTNPVMPSVSGSRGDYVTNTGAFRPNEYTVNKGMYTSNMPGAVVGTQQFAQFGAEILPPALEAPPVEFAPLIPPPQEEYTITSETTNPSEGGNNYGLQSAGNYVLPLKEWNVRSGFGNRVAPIPGASTDHNGVDLRAKPNTEVFAPFDGVVSKIYYAWKGGKQMVITHDDGTRSGYAHLNDYKVKVGDRVSKGQFIALTGNTGNSKGPHLHFTFTGTNGKKIDPEEVFGNYSQPSRSNNQKSPGGSIAVTHNNPGNIHYGDFVKQWGATKGSLDAGSTGNVAVFKTLEDGWDAFNKLLFGDAYNNLTIAEARNKWVTGNPSKSTSSTPSIIKEMGLDANTKVSSLTPEQKKKYSSLFVKHEDGNMYRKMKGLKLFEEGGEVDYNEGDVYDLTEDEIKQILESGGQLEFI